MFPKVNDERIPFRERLGQHAPNRFSFLDAPSLKSIRHGGNFHKLNRRDPAHEQLRLYCLRIFKPFSALLGNLAIRDGICDLSAQTKTQYNAS